MNGSEDRTNAFRVFAALAALLAAAGTLALRVSAHRGSTAARPPTAALPAPKTAAPATLRVPCWGCPESEGWTVRFRTDLDLLAPLGDGGGNAASWFKDFAKPDGSRYAEAAAAMSRAAEGPSGKILPPDDALLLEAEPWCDQATMRFYPAIFEFNGFFTQLPNLLLPLTFARSWAARGNAAQDPEKALEDFRRAIRLGRLLRQEDATIIADLVGMACIRHGAQGIYDLAARKGDATLALTAAIVLGEHAPQRLRTSQLLTKLNVVPFVDSSSQEMRMAIPDGRVDELVAFVAGSAERRFRGEALLHIGIVRFLGTPAQREKALALLDKLAASGDPMLSKLATWSRDTRPAKELFDGLSLPS